MKPVKSVLDPAFRYTSSVETDLRKTFARIRREQKRQQAAAAAAAKASRPRSIGLPAQIVVGINRGSN